MIHAQRMIETNPVPLEAGALAECIEACFGCAQACAAYADACLGEEDIQMLARCIRLDLDCADVCNATGKILSRRVAFEPEMVGATLRACAEACRRCESACNNVLSGMEA